MIKSIWFILFCSMLMNSCQTELVLLDCFEGIVTDKTTNEPIMGALIYTDSIAFNYFTAVVTKEDGYFFTPGLVVPNYDKGYSWRIGMSYNLIFRSEGYVTDTLDVRSISYERNETLDTIDLGIIYLTPVQ